VDAVRTEQAARQREELNGMYVAMTRARRWLAISSVAPRIAVDGSWWQRLAPLAMPVPEPDEDNASDGVDALAASAADDFMLQVLPTLALPPPLTTASVPTAKAATTPESSIGQAMHRLLEWAQLGAPVAGGHHVAAVMREFLLEAAQAEQASRMAAAILGGTGAWAWDVAEVDWHGNEVALNHQGQALRLDRLVRHRASGEWWVLDYKSALQPQRHDELVQQLRNYRAAVQAMLPGAVVRAAFLAGNGVVAEID
jgi:ATP-dependent helicase/nuclease subunit A